MSYIPQIQQELSVGNTTTETLSASATFTGVWEKTKNPSAQIWVQSQKAAILYIEFSPDEGTTTDQFPFGGITLTPGIPYYSHVSVGEQSFRIRIEDTSASTNDIISLVAYGDFTQQTAIVSTGISGDSPATITKNVNYGLNPGNTYSTLKEGGYASEFSTNTPLSGSASYDSGIVDVEGYTQLWTEIESDQPGTLVGTWYDDAVGTNILRTFTAPYDPSEELLYSTTVVLGKYLRYVFTNDATPQTRFHMRLKLDSRAYSGQMLKVNSFIPSNVLAALTRSVIAGQDVNGTYSNVLVNSGNALVTGNFDSEVELGNIDNYFIDSKYGYIENLQNTIIRTDDNTWVDLWYYGGKRTVPTSTFTPYIASTDSLDTEVDIEFTYLDAAGDKQTGTIALDDTDAQTPVSLGVTATELTRMNITGIKDSVGTIAIATTNNFTAGDPDNQDEVLIAAGPFDNQSQVCADKVPSGIKRRITHIYLGILKDNGSATSVQAVFQTRKSGTSIWRTRRPLFTSNSAPYDRPVKGIILNSGDDYRIRIRDVSDTNTWVEGIVDYEDLTI